MKQLTVEYASPRGRTTRVGDSWRKELGRTEKAAPVIQATTPSRMAEALTPRVASMIRIVARVKGTRPASSILSRLSMASKR